MTRKDALQAIKAKMDYYESDKRLRRAIETLIPELAESEDERIRIELKEAFEAYDIESKWNGIPIRSIFAWLEKQKEQKPARRDEVITLGNLPPYDKGFQDGKAEAMADLERAVTCGNVDNIPKWLQEELNKAFKKGQELSHEDYIRGYTNGYKDAEKRYNESVAYHYPEPVPPGVAYKSPQCYTDVIITPNTNSGTSTLKAEG